VLQEQHNRHKAIRAKLWFTEPPKAAPVEVITPIVKIIYARRPAWKLQEVHFDLHVQQYRKRLMSIASGPSIVYIQDRCRELDVSYADIIVPCRRREFVRPRQIIMWELRHKFNLSYPKIGKLFGNLDHTTVIASMRRVEILKARGEL
jgi:hypothetical protein